MRAVIIGVVALSLSACSKPSSPNAAASTPADKAAPPAVAAPAVSPAATAAPAAPVPPAAPAPPASAAQEGAPSAEPTTPTAERSDGARAEAVTAGLLQPGEVEALEAALLAAIAAQPESCPRPVLRGEARLGNGEEAAIKVITALSAESCAPLLGRGAIADDADLSPCMPAVGALREAVSYASGCSPWRAGKRAYSRPMALIQIGALVVAVANAELVKGQPDVAARLLLDGIRFTQDAMRGSSLLVSLVSTAAADKMLDALTGILAVAPDKPALIAEVRKLLESEPTFHDVLAGEDLYSQLYMVMPATKPAGWVPPGGWGDQRPPRPPAQGDKLFSGDQAVDSGLTWVAYAEARDDVLKACPKDASVATCAAGLEAVQAGAEGADAPTAAAIKILLSAKPAAEVRQQMVKTLRAIAMPNYAGIAERYDGRRARLQALVDAP